MLARRIKRDVKERGRDVEGILDQYLRFVKSSYDNFVQPSSRHADIVSYVSGPTFLAASRHKADSGQIVPGSSNQLAIELLVTHVKRQLDSRSLRFRRILADMEDREGGTNKRKAAEQDGLVLLEQTNQLLVSPIEQRGRRCGTENVGYHDDLARSDYRPERVYIPC